jgi:hypothetical protein
VLRCELLYAVCSYFGACGMVSRQENCLTAAPLCRSNSGPAHNPPNSLSRTTPCAAAGKEVDATGCVRSCHMARAPQASGLPVHAPGRGADAT